MSFSWTNVNRSSHTQQSTIRFDMKAFCFMKAEEEKNVCYFYGFTFTFDCIAYRYR